VYPAERSFRPEGIPMYSATSNLGGVHSRGEGGAELIREWTRKKKFSDWGRTFLIKGRGSVGFIGGASDFWEGGGEVVKVEV